MWDNTLRLTVKSRDKGNINVNIYHNSERITDDQLEHILNNYKGKDKCFRLIAFKTTPFIVQTLRLRGTSGGIMFHPSSNIVDNNKRRKNIWYNELVVHNYNYDLYGSYNIYNLRDPIYTDSYITIGNREKCIKVFDMDNIQVHPDSFEFTLELVKDSSTLDIFVSIGIMIGTYIMLYRLLR